ncbi:Glucan synthesis regulatory protein [Pleurostoma richardsiae]|uniref:Glucan synthesis regulatory protein n=1 Tax=Pleurostoma richardsiae TaxID=41990 RepID=A0AA38RB27_9PEZI|nr:Glucan synthesis regulatory protein [Pleurostoma richardsiae]
MANSISSVFRSFWHTMTSYDRHSTPDSPYRSGAHVRLSQGGRVGVLTSVATASESRADITSPYMDDTAARFSESAANGGSTSYQGAAVSPAPPMSPGFSGQPYSPGMRSHIARSSTNDGFETQSPAGEIPMQSFQDGLPPPPPPAHSWERIDAWAEENYPELYDQLSEGCTVNDLNELEHQLDCSLPMDVRESLQVHDGQECGGIPTGIIFSSMLLDCEEIVLEWNQWRRVNQEILLDTTVVKPAVPTKVHGASSEASSSKAAPSPPVSPSNPMWRQDLQNRQDSVPPNAVRKAYAHPAWIPLVRDWGGNNLAVDLAPGPAGQWGQVIIFGRDYDTKYVVARSWAHFLAIVADDLNSGKWYIDEDTNELKLREFKAARVEPGYLDILRWRADQKYGRRGPKRRSMGPGPARSPTGASSPYASPTEPNGEPRGRPLQRLSNVSPVSSPIRPGYGKSSLLARVTEETPLPDASLPDGVTPGKLVEVETPRVSDDENKVPKLSSQTIAETSSLTDTTLTDVEPTSAKVNGKQPVTLEDAMKTIEI